VRRATERVVFPEENADIGAGFGVLDVSPHEKMGHHLGAADERQPRLCPRADGAA